MSAFTEKQIKYWHKDRHRRRRDPRHPVIRAYVEPKIRILRRFVQAPPQSILDVGAGNGYFTHYLVPGLPTTAVDYSSVILEANPAKNKKVMDARALTFPDNSFDLTFCHALLHHIDTGERLQVIREMTRVSKKHVVIIEPNRNNPFMAAFGLLKKEEWGLLRFSLRYLRDLAEKEGLGSSSHLPTEFLRRTECRYPRRCCRPLSRWNHLSPWESQIS